MITPFRNSGNKLKSKLVAAWAWKEVVSPSSAQHGLRSGVFELGLIRKWNFKAGLSRAGVKT